MRPGDARPGLGHPDRARDKCDGIAPTIVGFPRVRRHCYLCGGIFIVRKLSHRLCHPCHVWTRIAETTAANMRLLEELGQ